MILLGLLLLGATGAFIGLLIAYNISGGPEYTVTMFDNDLATMNSLSIFLAGLALALLFCIGGVLAMSGRVRRRHRSALREARAEAEKTAAERDALRERAMPGPADTALADQERTASHGPSHRRSHRPRFRHLLRH
jgi:hypothetical protein